MLELNCEGLMDKSIIECFRAWVDPGFEIGGCSKCARKQAKKIHSATLPQQVWAPWT